MDNMTTLLDRLLAFLFLPATFWGAMGGLAYSMHERKNFKATLVEVSGGVITANMLEPVVLDYCPEKWATTALFLCGLGGLRLSMLAYGALASAVEKRIRRRTGGEE